MIVLAVPVIAIVQWVEKLGPLLGPARAGHRYRQHQEDDCRGCGAQLSRHRPCAVFCPGTPWPARSLAGAALAEAALFEGAMWLFTPLDDAMPAPELTWRAWVQKMGARVMDLDAEKHDRVCAWVSHLPQFCCYRDERHVCR